MTIIIKPKTDPNSGLDIDLLINPISRMRSSDAICPPKINLANRYDLPDRYKLERGILLIFLFLLVSSLIHHFPLSQNLDLS